MPETLDYLETSIELPSEGNGYKFRIRGADEPNGLWTDYPSLDDAKKAVEAAARAATKMSLAVLTYQGDQEQITGISRRDGSFLGLPGGLYGIQAQAIYVDLPGVADTLRLIVELRAQIDALVDSIAGFQLHRHGGGRMSPQGHLEAVDRLQKTYQGIVDRYQAAEAARLSTEEIAETLAAIP